MDCRNYQQLILCRQELYLLPPVGFANDPDRFGDKIGTLEGEVLEQVVLALALVTGVS
jgi:hypothetical protein